MRADEPESPSIASGLLRADPSDVEQQAKIKLPSESSQKQLEGGAAEPQAQPLFQRCFDLLAKGQRAICLLLQVVRSVESGLNMCGTRAGWLVADGYLSSFFGVDKSRYDWEVHQHHYEQAEVRRSFAFVLCVLEAARQLPERPCSRSMV